MDDVIPRICENCVYFMNDCGFCIAFDDFHFQPDLFCFSLKSLYLKND